MGFQDLTPPTTELEIFHGLEMCKNITPLPQDVMDSMNAKYAKSWHGNMAIILNLDRPSNELGYKEIGIMTHADFKKGLADKRVNVGEKGRLMEVSELWLQDSRARRYEDTQFHPFGIDGEDPCLKYNKNVFNLWTGFQYEPRVGDCKQYLYLVEKILCGGDEKEFDWLLKWAASTIQKPDTKLGTAPAFIGAQGTGKGCFVSHLGALHGKSYKHVTNEDQIIGRFNLHLCDATIIFLDEACISNVKAADKIKGLITEKAQMLEGKGLACVQTRSYSNIILASNHEHSALSIQNGDRRFVLFSPSTTMKGNTDFWESLNKEMLQDGGREALLHVLNNVNLEGWSARQKPDSERMRIQTFDMATSSMPAVDKWLFHTLSTGTFPFDREPGGKIAQEDLYSAFSTFASASQLSDKTTNIRHFGQGLKRSLPMTMIDHGVRNKKRVKSFKGLDACRKEFETKHQVGDSVWN